MGKTSRGDVRYDVVEGEFREECGGSGASRNLCEHFGIFETGPQRSMGVRCDSGNQIMSISGGRADFGTLTHVTWEGVDRLCSGENKEDGTGCVYMNGYDIDERKTSVWRIWSRRNGDLPPP